MAVAAPLARRVIAPRLASSAAVLADKASKAIAASPNVAQKAAVGAAPTARGLGGSTRAPLPKVSPKVGEEEEKEKKAPKKGPEKWANDGIEKLKEHGADAEQLKKLKETAAGRKILVAASDLKPGSKAMAKLMERLS